MLKFILIYPTLVFVFIAFGCENSSIQSNVNNKKPASFTKEIQLSKNRYHKGEPNIFYTSVKMEASQLKLDSLESGFDSIQIRIWFDISLLRKQRLIVISKSNDKWIANLYILTLGSTKNSHEDSIFKFDFKPGLPKSGWNDFTKRLFDLQITTLPDMDNIAGYGSGMDGIGCNIEVATKTYYRFYRYWEPKSYQAKFWQAKQMTKILELIEQEFDFYHPIHKN